MISVLAPVSLHRGPTVAQARRGLEGTAGCAMARTRRPPLGASASTGTSSVSSPRNRPLTRARPPHHARAPSFQACFLEHGCRPPPPQTPPLRQCLLSPRVGARPGTSANALTHRPFVPRCADVSGGWHSACTESLGEPGAWETQPTRPSEHTRGLGDPTTPVAAVPAEVCGRRRTY